MQMNHEEISSACLDDFCIAISQQLALIMNFSRREILQVHLCSSYACRNNDNTPLLSFSTFMVCKNTIFDRKIVQRNNQNHL